MTDNERIQKIKKRAIWGCNLSYEDQQWLIEQLEQRDKTIAELDRQYAVVVTKAINLELQNEVMLPALERIYTIAEGDVTEPVDAIMAIWEVTWDAIAKVKALTVSKQEAEVQAE